MNILGKISDFFRDILYEAVSNAVSGIFDMLNENILKVTDLTSKRPDEFNSSIFSFIEEISKKAVLPVAGIVLAVIFTMEIVKLANDRNAFKDISSYDIAKPIFKIGITIEILKRMMYIVLFIFRISQYIIQKATPYLTTNAKLDATKLAQVLETLKNESAGSLLGIFLEAQLFKLLVLALVVVINLIVYGRMIEIYLMCAVSPIPTATLTSDTTWNFGKNFFKSIFALALQGFLMVVCIGIFGILVTTSDFTNVGFTKIMLDLIFYAVLLCFTMFKSGSIAKSIFS